MAYCIHCGAEFQDGRFIEDHDPSCPDYIPSRPAHKQKRVDQTDKAEKFDEIWPVDYPQPEPEYRFAAELVGKGEGLRQRLAQAGLRDWRFDRAWPDYMVAVEVDGNAWHVMGGGRHMQDTDLEKLNMAQALGWRVFRLSPAMIRKESHRWVPVIKDVLDGSNDV